MSSVVSFRHAHKPLDSPYSFMRKTLGFLGKIRCARAHILMQMCRQTRAKICAYVRKTIRVRIGSRPPIVGHNNK